MKPFICAFALIICCLVAKSDTPKVKTFVSKEGRFTVKIPARPAYSATASDTDPKAIIGQSFVLDKGD